MNQNSWPTLSFPRLQGTIESLHQWIQIVGKIRLRSMPWQNHSWHSTLYISPNGFSTHGIPYGGTIFQIEFDFRHHQLHIQCSNSGERSFDLEPMSVAEFHDKVFEILRSFNINVEIHGAPNEVDPAIPFVQNISKGNYDPEAARILWEAMARANAVFNVFRSEFIGKVSPVHLFWGAFDLAVSRFSGKPAPLHPGGMPNMPLEVMQEAYSHEVSSAGFWPGSKDFPTPIFYAYAYPSHPDFSKQAVIPESSFYSEEMGEFILKYEDLVQSDDPDKTLLDFLESTYEAACKTSGWDREMLERKKSI